MAISKRKRSAWRGVTKLRKTLRRIDPEVTKELKESFEQYASNIADTAAYIAYSKGLYDEGDLIASIEYQMGRDGLTALIGPGAKRIKISKSAFDTRLYVKNKDKHAALQFFKGYWAEFGTKGATDRNIPPQVPRPFMNPAYDAYKDKITRETRRMVAGILRQATRETTDG